MNRNKKGFSIIEVLFSIAIISLVIVMVIIFYSYMMKVSAKGVDITIAAQVAESKLNEIASDKNSLIRSKIATDVEIGKPYVVTGVQKNGKTDYYWLVKISAMSGTNYSLMKLFYVDVLVFWWADDNITENNGGVEETVNNNDKKMKEIVTEFSKDEYIDDSKITKDFASKSTNTNEGYKFVRLSRIISKD